MGVHSDSDGNVSTTDPHPLTYAEYQARSAATAVFPKIQISLNGGPLIDAPWLYPLLGLLGEAGELAEKFKKTVRDRDGRLTAEDQGLIQKERGDVMWYLARLAEAGGTTLIDAAAANLAKLESRQARRVRKGSGDTR